MPVYDYAFLLQSATANTTAAVTTNEVDFGVTTPAVNQGGKFGLHVVVTTAFTSLTEGVVIWILHGSAGSLTTSSTKHTGMFIPVASLTLGAHFFIPCGSIPLLRYATALWSPVSTAGATGATTMYFGDAEPTQ